MGNEVVEESDLIVDIRLGRTIDRHIDIAKFGSSFLHTLCGRGEIANANQFRHIHNGDIFTGAIWWAGRLTAVIVLRDHGRRSTRFSAFAISTR